MMEQQKSGGTEQFSASVHQSKYLWKYIISGEEMVKNDSFWQMIYNLYTSFSCRS